MNIFTELFVVIFGCQIGVFALFNILMLWASKKPSGINKSKKLSFKIALVVPCYNEESVIKDKLDNSVAAVSFNNQCNIYVVDDGSTDNTFKLAEEYREKHKLKNLFIWKNPGRNGKPNALNWIFNKISEDIVVITDADASLEKNAIAELISVFGDPQVGAVTGRLVVCSKNNLAGKEEGLYRRLVELWRKGESNLDSCAIFNGPIMAIRTELASKLKIAENTYADDTCLAYKVRRLGFRAVYESEAVASEGINDSVVARVKQEIRRARGLTKLVLGNIDMVGRFGYFGRVIFPFSVFNYVLSPILNVLLLFLLPFVIMQYPVLLALLVLLLIPVVRTAVFGYLYRHLALVVGLITPSRGRWKPTRN